MNMPFFRVALYLFWALIGFFLGGFLPDAVLGKAVFLLFILLSCLYEIKKEGGAPPRFRPHRPLSSLLFLPLLLGATVGLSALTSLILPPSPAPAFTFPVFLASALFPALCEELLFRFLALRLLSPYGKGKAVLFSALFFALFHQSFYQIPYAFAAGLILGAAAVYSDSLTLPICLHLLNNLLSLAAGQYFTLPLVLALVGIGLASGGALLFLERKSKLAEKTPREAVSFLSFSPALPFVLFCLCMASYNLLRN